MIFGENNRLVLWKRPQGRWQGPWDVRTRYRGVDVTWNSVSSSCVSSNSRTVHLTGALAELLLPNFIMVFGSEGENESARERTPTRNHPESTGVRPSGRTPANSARAPEPTNTSNTRVNRKLRATFHRRFSVGGEPRNGHDIVAADVHERRGVGNWTFGVYGP